MQILVIHYKEINKYPPVKTLIELMLESGNTVTLYSYDDLGYAEGMKDRANLKCKKIRTVSNTSGMGLLRRYIEEKKTRKEICEDLKKYDIVWTTTDRTITYLGKALLSCNNHVMQLMELVDDIQKWKYTFTYNWFIHKVNMTHLDEYARHAKYVVVPEYNRAQIIKAWWDLKRAPIILPNKPNQVHISNIPDTVLYEINRLVDLKKKIILYQGIFSKERRLREFAQAVELLGSEYVLCLMGQDNQYRKELCAEYSNIFYVPFIKPPYHLKITELAHICILTYYPAHLNRVDDLNIIYCAPNKIFEYALAGKPMVGNDIPGLSGPFTRYGIGAVFREYTPECICNALYTVNKKYSELSKNCIQFYNSVDTTAIVRDILSSVKKV